MTLAPSLEIKNQSIGVASEANNFQGVDGILGIGPVDLTKGTLSDKSKSIPTVTDNLYTQKAIPSNSMGIFYVPASAQDSSVCLSLLHEINY